MSSKVPTTIKLEPSIYDDFKVLGIRQKFSLQSFVEKAIIRYVNDENFRNDMDAFKLSCQESIKSGHMVESISSESIVNNPLPEIESSVLT